MCLSDFEETNWEDPLSNFTKARKQHEHLMNLEMVLIYNQEVPINNAIKKEAVITSRQFHEPSLILSHIQNNSFNSSPYTQFTLNPATTHSKVHGLRIAISEDAK